MQTLYLSHSEVLSFAHAKDAQDRIFTLVNNIASSSALLRHYVLGKSFALSIRIIVLCIGAVGAI